MKKNGKKLDRSYRHGLTVRLGNAIMDRLYTYQKLCVQQEDRRSVPLVELVERLVNSGKLSSAKAVEELNEQDPNGYGKQLMLRLDQSTMERLRKIQERLSKPEKKATLVYSLQRIIAAAPIQ